MPDVQSIGYAMPPQQNQYMTADNINSAPMIYEPEIEEKSGSSFGWGTLTVTALAAAAIGGFIGHKVGAGKEGLDAVKKELEELKNSEAVKNYDKLKEATEKLEETVEKKSWWNFHGVKKAIKEAFAPFKKDAAKVENEAKDDVKKTTETVSDEVKKTADDAKSETQPPRRPTHS